MNWAAVAAITSTLALVVAILGIPYLAGRSTERMDGHDRRISEHSAELAQHREQIVALDKDVALLQQWRDGYNAAAGVSGRGGV
jgi:hypothetical protein